ncbi:MAG: cob(I)yrinic acid a,c-diamide adenosyltransferase [Cyanobacteria bacterium J06634_6]
MVSQLRVLPDALPTPLDASPAPVPTIQRHPLLSTIEGTVQVFTSKHRTFFTNVMVQAMRVAEQGLPVLVVQFLKGGIGQGPENPMSMGQNLDWVRCGSPTCIKDPNVDDATRAAVQELWTHTQLAIRGGVYGLIVLDELSLAIDFGLVSENEVLTLIRDRPSHVEIIFTGPQMPESLLDVADQVTQFRRNYIV